MGQTETSVSWVTAALLEGSQQSATQKLVASSTNRDISNLFVFTPIGNVV